MAEFDVDIDNDNNTLVSDITLETTNTDDLNTKIESVRKLLIEELNKLNLDILKEKAKDLGIGGAYKHKKTLLVPMIVVEFEKSWDILNNKKLVELKGICKSLNIKKFATMKKYELCYQIMLSHISTLNLVINYTTTNNEIKDNNDKNDKIMRNEEQELLERQQKAREEQELLERQQKTKEKEESKRKKQSIPKHVRTIVWNHYIGEDIIKHKCLCCKKVTISNTTFDVGHVLSEKNGGSHEINNLRPICGACNHSMGTENMVEFVIKYGLYIG